MRGGGHNLDNAALRDGTLLIDVSGLDSVDIDAAAKRAKVGDGCGLHEAAWFLGAHPLGLPQSGRLITK